jgi:hypothetical protein
MRAQVPLQGRRISRGKKLIAQLEATGSPEHFCFSDRIGRHVGGARTTSREREGSEPLEATAK